MKNIICGCYFNMSHSCYVFVCMWLCSSIHHVACDPVEHVIDPDILDFINRTTRADRQLYEFKMDHPEPIGLLTTSSGLPVDIRDTFTMNTNQFKNEHHFDLLKHTVNKRIPERVVHAKGTGAWGYFIVENDVSEYTNANVFNDPGKITPVFGRFSTGTRNLGGSDVGRDLKGVSLKFFTKQGNLDLLCLNFPVYFYRDSINFANFVAATQRNGKTNLRDATAILDLATKKPELLPGIFWLLSDYGIPNGYRKADYFPIHTYELHNKHGERYFAKFNFRSEQGIENLPTSEAIRLAGIDPDYFTRDLYDAIAEKNYPTWALEMYIMSYKDVLNIDYDPFEITRLWKRGTYKTIPVGRLIFNENIDNHFRDVELSAFNPANLVPGIPGPIDSLFRGRRFAYRDAHIHRLGANHNRIPVNAPMYRKEYNRDGNPPVDENMWDAPIYFPNSFSGPVPYVDQNRPQDSLSVLETEAIDLGEPAYFYHNILTSEDQRERLINTTASYLLPTAPFLQQRAIRLFTLIDPVLGQRLVQRVEEAKRIPRPRPPIPLIVSRNNVTDLNANYLEHITGIKSVINIIESI